MDSRIEHPQGHMHADDSQNAGLLPPAEGREDELSHEKTSVLTKVKAKAKKKIKDTLKKYGQSHDRDDEHQPDERYIPDDHDLDREEKMVEDPEVHAGTESEFVPVRSAIPEETENSGKSKLDFGRLAATREDAPSPGERHESKIIKPIKGIQPNTGQPMFKFGNPTASGEKPQAPQNTPISPPPGDYGTKATDPTKTLLPGEEGRGQPKINLERPMGLEEDPHVLKDRSKIHTPAIYQTKVTDPTDIGGEEAGTAPIFQSFDKMKVHDEPNPKPTKTFVLGEEGTGQPKVNLERPMSLEEDPLEPKDRSEPHNPAIYQTKVTDPTGTGGEEARIAPILQSFDKMKIHDEPKPKPTKTFVPGEEGIGQPKVNLERPMGMEEDPPTPKDRSEPHTPAIYQTKLTNPTGTGGEEAGIAPILQSFDKMKVHDEPKPKPTGPDDNSPASIRKQFPKSPTGRPDQFSPDLVPSEAKIVRDKSQRSKSFDATKLSDDSHDISEEPMNERSSTEKTSYATSAIADKGISVKNAVASKLGYGEKDMTSGTEVRQSGDSAKSSQAEYGKKIADTVTEDRALAEVTSDTLHKPNEKPGKGEMQPIDKGTEAEVARQLGTKEDNYRQGMQSSDVNNSQEKGVVNKLKGAVGSWFGLGGESQPQVSPQPHGSSYGDEGISPSANEDGVNSNRIADEGRRLQEK